MPGELNDLHTYKARVETALDAGQIGIWTWFPNEDRLVWDKTMFEIYDMDEREFNGKLACIDRRLHPEDKAEVYKHIEEILANDGVYHNRFRIIDRGGNIRHIACKGRMSTDGKNKVMSGINFDITKLVHVEQELERSNKELEQFAYAISHDLQEPLRTITSFVDLLRKKELDGQSSKYLDFMEQSSRRMKRMISDLLEYSKASPSAKNLKVSEFDPSVIVTDACNLLRVSIQETNAQIVIDAMPMVRMNPSHLSQIFQNLINNALKYSKDGEIPQIQISCREGPKYWEFCVEDNGIGIDSRYQDKLFQLFQRIGPRAKHGSGIGLALCKRIVSIYRGRIWIRSELDKGARVHFTIPKKLRDSLYENEE